MIYIILLLLYWGLGVFVLVKLWTRDLDLHLGTLIFFIVIAWLIWPLILIAEDKTLIIKRDIDER